MVEKNSEPEILPYRLICLSRPLNGHIIDLESYNTNISIGRSESLNCVHIDNSAISKKHCSIILKNGKYFVIDLNSRNGTFVNNKKIESNVLLDDGDIIRLGDFEMIYRERGEHYHYTASCVMKTVKVEALGLNKKMDKMDNFDPFYHVENHTLINIFYWCLVFLGIILVTVLFFLIKGFIS